MGNKVSKKRDTLVKSVETAATAEEPAATHPAEEPEVPKSEDAADAVAENVDVVVGELVTPVVCLPSEDCTSDMKQAEGPAATQNDPEPKPVPTETPAPLQPELLISVREPPSKSELAKEPKTTAEAELAPTTNLETETEVVPEPTSGPAPAPAEEQQTDVIAQECLTKPVISSSTFIDLGVPDMALQPANTPPSPALIHGPVNADKPSDIPLTEECQESAEAAEISKFELEKPEETSDSLNEPAAENLEQFVSDVNEDSVSRLLKNLELQRNDLVTDLIPSDVKIPDDTPNTDICKPTELM